MPPASHAYQPGYMYIAMGQEKAEKLVRPERKLLDGNVDLTVDTITQIDPTAQTVTLGSGTVLTYGQLVIATGSRILPEDLPNFESEAHHFYIAPRPPRSCARRSTRSRAARS